MKTVVIRTDPAIAQLLKFADERYVLPFNPLRELPFRIPQPQPDPAPDVRGFALDEDADDVAGHALILAGVAGTTFLVMTNPLAQAAAAYAVYRAVKS
ncbi:MAG TPA: hypothetical protein VFO85_06970 [Vicinamibacteria bacterium]|nr:hypothetical protein [Vicinamibacteria bacterium]